MRGRFRPEHLTSYPGMSGEDTIIWNRFIAIDGANWTSVDYNVRVGQGDEVPKGTEPNYAHMITTLSQLRIDAVLYRDDTACVVEVKPRGTVATVGQIITYREMFRETHGEGLTVIACLVCENVKPDITVMLRRIGASVVIV